jgi:hypothetical protein
MLNKQNYIDLIKAGFDKAKGIDGDPEAQSKAIYNGIASAIMAAFEDADIPIDTFTVPPGIPTVGSPAAQVTTGPGIVTGSKKLL